MGRDTEDQLLGHLCHCQGHPRAAAIGRCGGHPATGVDNAHDLTGRIFQRLIADRKYLATFYTLPASAALLARLAVAKMEGVDWSDAGAIGRLRIGDFACGTGALLSAVYEQIAARHERAGGDAAALHKVMMEEALYGCDVMPSAVHITGSTLSGGYLLNGSLDGHAIHIQCAEIDVSHEPGCQVVGCRYKKNRVSGHQSFLERPWLLKYASQRLGWTLPLPSRWALRTSLGTAHLQT